MENFNSTRIKKIIFQVIILLASFTSFAQNSKSSFSPYNKLLPYKTSRVGTDITYDSIHNCLFILN